MSLLVEIATRADVPLESVVRVLTREPVNEDHKWRILSVLDGLGPEETRVLQRFALAAVHDAIPRQGPSADHEAAVAELVDDPLLLPEAVRLEPGPAAEPAELPAETPQDAGRLLPAPVEPAPLVQLGSVLEELTEAVRDLRRETDAERRERVDDLAVLIDLISKGWQGVDRRLGRVERQLGRLESPERRPPRPLPAAIEPPPVPVPAPGPPAPAPDPDPGPDPEHEQGRSAVRRRLPLLAALAVGIGLGALAALDLPTRFDASALVDPSEGEESAAPEAPEPQLAPALTLRPTTSSVLGTTDADSPLRTTPAPRTGPGRTVPATTAPATTTPATTTPATTGAARNEPARSGPAAPTDTGAQAGEAAFTPSRNWAWPPTTDADYYLVEFFRAGKLFYRARPTEPRLTLPERLRFTAGTYRWRVRPGVGAPAANRLAEPIVDSEFILPR
jgi:hypothetical protein